MPGPQALLAAAASEAIARAFGAEWSRADPVLRPTTNPAHGDFQVNAALAMAKALARPSRELAEAIAAHLDVGGICSRVDVGGPGFVNLTLDDTWIGAQLTALAGDERLGVTRMPDPERVVLDYSSPNVAREMHVGHLRSTVIGDCLARVLSCLGHDVVRQNHLGDWGTQFGLLLEHLVDAGWTAAGGELADLNALYKEAQDRFQTESGFADRARARVVALQAGDPATLALWRALIRESERHLEAVYARLGVLLEPADIAAESSYNDRLDDMAAELEAAGLARLDQGALCAFPPGFRGRDGEPMPFIVRKSDGGYPYAATDLAALRHRVRGLGATRIIYAVDARQSQHLAMVFAVGEQAGWLAPGQVGGARAEHVGFGAILGPDGRPFRTRAGDTVKLADLLDEAVMRADGLVAEKNPALAGDERAAVARAAGIGAVKYADLANDRIKDYAFDWARMLAMDGNTAPYLQYAHARVRSIFRRAEGVSGSEVLIGHPAERVLGLYLLGFGDTVSLVAGTLQPHRLCTYLFELAQAFTAFYEACPVLRAETDETRRSRLSLCAASAGVLAQGLGLLGIEAPERM